jgi:hypothetical protein
LENELDQPPPTLVNDYLNYLLTEGQLPQFEQSVIKLPVECMDLHQVNKNKINIWLINEPILKVMTACREHQLFDGICYVFNNAMRDYISPLIVKMNYKNYFLIIFYRKCSNICKNLSIKNYYRIWKWPKATNCSSI